MTFVSSLMCERVGIVALTLSDTPQCLGVAENFSGIVLMGSGIALIRLGRELQPRSEKSEKSERGRLLS
jgi:hypothetical protein